MILTSALLVPAMMSGCGGGGEPSVETSIPAAAGLDQQILSTAEPEPPLSEPEARPDEGSFVFDDDAANALAAVGTEEANLPSLADAGEVMAGHRQALAAGASAEQADAGAEPVLLAHAGGLPAESGSATVLPGTGLKSRLAAGCTPNLKADFIDDATWDNRRVMPRDCLEVQTNPPVFSWRQPPNRDVAQPWTLTLQRKPSAAAYAVHTVASPRLALHQALPAGEYEWTVSYVSKSGKTVASLPRRFTVASGAKHAVFPGGAQFAAAVMAKPWPRVLPAGASFAGIANAAPGSDLEAVHASVIAAADQALTTNIPAVPDGGSAVSQSKSMEQKIDLTALRKTLDREQRFIEALGYAARFTGDTRYRDAGIERTLALAQWATHGVTSEENFDYANRAIYVSLGQSLDLYAGWLSSRQVAAIVAPLKNRIAQAMARFDSLDTNPFNSHVDIIIWSVLDALMHSSGSAGFDEAPAWLARTWELLLTTANVWGADDGGFGNGVAYAWYRMDNIGQVLAAIRVIGGVNLAEHPSISRLGDYLLAFTAPRGTHRGAFGDGAEITTHFAHYAANQYRLYAALTGSAVHDWYWRMDTVAERKGRYFSPWHLMLGGLALPAPVAAAPQEHSWAFEDAGVTAMHSNSAAPSRSSVFFRASEFGSAVHSHADQNSFTLVSHGKDLLISGGYYPYFLSPHHATVTRATRYKNALTFDGGIGQAEAASEAPAAPGQPVPSRDARGELLNFADTGVWAVSTGDATPAYRSYDRGNGRWTPLLSDAVRSVAYNRSEKVVVVYDYAASATARRWELNFNALSAFTAGGSSAWIANSTASACIDVYGPPGAFATGRRFAVAPENGAADQYHARFSASRKSSQLVAVTVIREDCRNVPVSVTLGGGAGASVAIKGAAAIQFDRRTVTIP